MFKFSPLSPSELTRTSISDKKWLGILEEQLYSDVLADEFYQLLQTPWEQVLEGEDISEKENIKIKEDKILEKEREIFTKFLLKENAKSLFEDTINMLAEKLSMVCTDSFLYLQKLITR